MTKNFNFMLNFGRSFADAQDDIKTLKMTGSFVILNEVKDLVAVKWFTLVDSSLKAQNDG